jgi:hypothetical protein
MGGPTYFVQRSTPMPKEPSYPETAAVDGGDADAGGAAAPEGNQNRKRKKQFVTRGVAVGIGSAAIVAALLYANRSKGGDRDDG